MLFRRRGRKFNSRHSINPWVWVAGAVIVVFLVISSCRELRKVKPTVGMQTSKDYWVRVLLYSGANKCDIEVPQNSTIQYTTGSDTSEFVLENLNFNIKKDANGVIFDDKLLNAIRYIIKPGAPYVFSINGQSFRGHLEIITRNGKFDVINKVPLEAYLMGVVGAEMPVYWRAEALKAQTIAARTYCLYYKIRYGSKRYYDIKRTQANQVYRGISAENWRVRNAVNDTSGQVLVCGDEIFPSFYSAVCGGHTDASEDVFGKGFDCLVGVACPYCKNVARKKYFFWGPVKFSSDEVNKKLANKYSKVKKLGKITDIQARRKSNYDGYARWTNVRLINSKGKSVTLRGEDLRLSLDPTGMKLKSTIFDLAKIDSNWVFSGGRGFGHGVGMCQTGAQGLAKKGYKAEQILKYYYKGSEIKKLY